MAAACRGGIAASGSLISAETAMEWLSVSVATPWLVDVALGDGAALVALLAACVPAWLAVRDALRRSARPARAPRAVVVVAHPSTRTRA